jgi:hypothetical protein
VGVFHYSLPGEFLGDQDNGPKILQRFRPGMSLAKTDRPSFHYNPDWERSFGHEVRAPRPPCYQTAEVIDQFYGVSFRHPQREEFDVLALALSGLGRDDRQADHCGGIDEARFVGLEVLHIVACRKAGLHCGSVNEIDLGDQVNFPRQSGHVYGVRAIDNMILNVWGGKRAGICRCIHYHWPVNMQQVVMRCLAGKPWGAATEDEQFHGTGVL